MGSSFGGTVKLTGESEYRRALKDITNNLKVLNSEMKTITSQYDKNDKSSRNLTQQNEVLNKKIAEQKQKVALLTDALEKSKQETGDNSDTTKKWQVQLNNAQADLNKMEKKLKDNTEALNREDDSLDKAEKGMKDYSRETDDASTKTSRFADVLKAQLTSEAIIGGVKALGRAMAQVGRVAFDLGKQSIEAYAQYEQLVGGIETLFGAGGQSLQEYAKSMGKSVGEVRGEYNNLMKSQSMVMKDANEAFRTAGMSANQYMEMATSFSASLLQSLGGDTVKASQYAKMAIIDMSDNANKMGTNIQDIQNAYQGFSKQNYTMLDNLKLGYGGTKSEMERLLADAEKLTGVKYDINNLSDVYEAIHVIQGELGITGTTAKEASTTIEGSMKMMQASWENMLVGISDDNANFNQLVDNLVESITIAGQNLLPRIATMIDGALRLILALSDRILENMPKLMGTGGKMLQSILDGIIQMLPKLGAVAGQLVSALTTFILNNLPMILQGGVTLVLELANGIASAIPNILPVAVETVMKLVDTLLANVDKVIDTGMKLLQGIISGLTKALPKLVAYMPTIIAKIIAKLISLIPKLIACAVELVGGIASGFVKGIPKVIGKVPQLISKLASAVKNGFGRLASAGRHLVEGIWRGISGGMGWIKSKISGWVGNVTSFIKRLFGIKSPSTLFRDEIGKNLALGIGVGFSDNMKNVATDMADAIPTEFDTDINANVGGSASGGFSYHSMIRAFIEAFREMKVELDDREVGNFVVKTVEKEVFA